MQVMLDVDEVQGISAALKQAPEPRRVQVSRCEAIQMLAPDIATLQSKGYSLAQIAGMLTELGLKVSSLGLKGYLRDARGRRSRKKKRPARTTPGDHAGDAVVRESGGPAVSEPVGEAVIESGGGPAMPHERPGGAQGVPSRSEGGREAERGVSKRGEEPGVGPAKPAASAGGGARFLARRPTGVGAAASGATPTTAVPKGTFVPREDTEDL